MNEPLKQSLIETLTESSALDWAAYYRALLPMQEVPLELIVKPPPQIAPHKVAGNSATKTIAYEYLAFTLGHEEYGIDILKIQEIRGYESVTRIANTPDFIKGVINLRGTIIPIIDMRIKFNLGEPSYDAMTVVIILDMASQVMGMVVDTVSDVINLKPEQIKPTPELGLAFGTHYLVGLGTYEDRMVLLMDIESLMSSAEMGLMKAASA